MGFEGLREGEVLGGLVGMNGVLSRKARRLGTRDLGYTGDRDLEYTQRI
jgi:hypothetical protein